MDIQTQETREAIEQTRGEIEATRGKIEATSEAIAGVRRLSPRSGRTSTEPRRHRHAHVFYR
jgi:hypothetical protein